MFDLAGADLVKLFTQEFELCAVRPGETVVILAEPSSRGDYVAAAFAAARAHGAKVVNVTVPGGSPVAFPTTRTGTAYGLASIDETQVVMDLLKSADFIVDLTLEALIHSPRVGEILGQGARMLYICEPPDVLARNMTTVEDKAFAKAEADKMAAGALMRITSAAGTDLSADLTDCHPGFQCGFTDDPGRWDHWPSLMVLCWPSNDGVNGVLVLDVNDIVFPFKEYMRSPVKFTIEHGFITKIEGEQEAAMLERFLFDAGDEARFTSHMGWGLQKSADWWSMAMYDKESNMGMEGRAARGNFLISTGPNRYMNRYTPYHLDIPMRSCSISIDSAPVTQEGKLVG